METVRQRLFAALRAIQRRVLLAPGATPAEQAAALVDAYALVEEALALEAVFDSDASAELEMETREL